ncbi:protein angel homolog 2 isoform X1 [Acanthochromis polyacanthus]|uniref:protein angel homolog 2 isoform X1 n=2 Tax=Acanthochromis polyacanthus TaxID=80966 RepID=UPI002233F238|nr:protein angel homolog 2 isoform X1 [Acanthochromis polyacanthus]
MRPSRNVNDGSSFYEENHPMFLRRLSSFSSTLPPFSHPALSQASFRSSSASSYLPHFTPTPHPWSSVQGFPPWPPQLPHSHPSAHQVFPGRTLHPLNINPGPFGGRWRSFYTTASGMMEHSDREPPYKRRKSVEDKRSAGESDGHRATGGKSLQGDSRREHHHQGSAMDGSLRSNHQLQHGGQDGGKNGAGKGVSRETSRGKDVERTKSVTKDRQRKNSSSRDGSPHRARREPQQRDSQTQDTVSVHKPNPWFKNSSTEEQGGLHRNTKGPAEQQRDGGRDGGQWMGFVSSPHSTTLPSNPWQVAGANRQHPPPGVSQPVKPLQRHWEACSSDLQPPGDSTVFDFSVMSYNILSQELLQDNAYLYRHCNPGVLPWEYRLPNLLAEIQQHNADILCLQEVQQDHYENQIKPALQALGYHCEYKKRTGRKPDGCAVTFKTSRFSLLSSNPVEFFRPGDALLDRDNVGLVLQLRPNDTLGQSDPSAFICVANTHLLYNPRRGDIKLAQLAILLAEIGRLSHLPDGSANPVVLCGDFNSTPWSPLYNFLIKGCLDYQGMQIGMVSGQENSPRGQRLLPSPIWSHRLGITHQCQYENKPTAECSPTTPTAVEGAISNLSVEDLATKAVAAFNRARIEHSLKLHSSYRHRLMPDGRPEITTCHSRTAMTVDYILYTPDFTQLPPLPGGRGLQLLGRLSLVGQSELEEVNGLPNQHHSSDHLPLLARFRFQR